MAWPFSRLRTYIAKSLPTLKASDVNSIQDALIGLFGGTLTIKKLRIDGTGNQDSSGDSNGDFHVSGTATANALASTTTVTAGTDLKGQHIRGTTSTPGYSLNNTGAGVGATGGVVGSDTCGVVTVTAAGSPSAGTVITVTFDVSYSPNTPRVVLHPGNGTAADLATQPYVSTTSSTFVINTSGTALSSGQTYTWAYQVMS